MEDAFTRLQKKPRINGGKKLISRFLLTGLIVSFFDI